MKPNKRTPARRMRAPTRTISKPKEKKTQEVGAIGQLLRTLGGLAGGTAGAMIGTPIAGSTTGRALGAQLSRWLGSGDYTVNQNSLVQKAANNIPMMHKTDQSVIIRHRELVGTIKGSIDFVLQEKFPINPGMASTFPWLSAIAKNFTEYEFKGLVFHFVTTSGHAISSTNSALGAVILQTDYRATDSQPTSKITMVNEYWANECIPSEDFCHPIECNPKENPFNIHYVRAGPIPAGDTLLMYDMGNTYVATQGMQAVNPVGDLWVTYEVVLKKPVVSSNVESLPFYTGSFGSSALSTLFTGPNSINNGLDGVNLTLGSNIINFGPGSFGFYQVDVRLENVPTSPLLTSGNWNLPAILVNLSPWSPYPSIVPTTTGQVLNALSGSTSLSYRTYVWKTDSESTATLTIPTPTATGTYSYCSVSIFGVGQL
jgi:hypothetical protein